MYICVDCRVFLSFYLFYFQKFHVPLLYFENCISLSCENFSKFCHFFVLVIAYNLFFCGARKMRLGKKFTLWSSIKIFVRDKTHFLLFSAKHSKLLKCFLRNFGQDCLMLDFSSSFSLNAKKVKDW